MLVRRAGQIVAFALLTTILYVCALFATSHVRVGRYSLLQGLTRDFQEPGGMFQSLRRFQEADTRGHVDILFLGASHTYRGYDPRVFHAAGYEVMNLGSTAQTPLNSYHLAQLYVPRLTPRLVVLDVFTGALTLDGLESTLDLSVNTSWSWPLQRMAIATENLGVVDFEAAKGLGFLPFGAAHQADIDGETYIAGGYCETHAVRTDLIDTSLAPQTVRPDQLDYLRATTELARKSGAQVLWVSAPLPRDYIAHLPRREELLRTIKAAAERDHVDFWDMSDMPELDPRTHFKDGLHMNAEGVAIFNRSFIEKLHSTRYSP